MVLSSSTYFVFLLAVLLVYWPLARYRLPALGLILLANYLFYARWDIWYLILIPIASTVDFAIGRGLEFTKDTLLRRLLVGASVMLNIGLLSTLRFKPDLLEHNLVLPLTLSFYAFQALTYTIDIYRGDSKSTPSYLAHLAAVSFFPTIIAGPITRVSSLVTQFEKRKPVAAVDGSRALFMIGMGLSKKLLIADFLSTNFVNRVFDFPSLYTGAENLLAVYAYAVQIYCDFSGYTDIARGSAMLMGFQLPVNFNRPYMSRNLADFWRRWHITLSHWLRDYLFFSLPGKRSKFMPYINLVITMVLGGLWHGANWNFAVWGLLHGVGLAVVRGWQTWRGAAQPSRAGQLFATLATFHFVAFAWIFFRAPNLETVGAILGQIGSLTISFENVSGPIALVLAIGLAAHYIPKKWNDSVVDLFVRAPFYAQAAVLLLLMLGLQNVVSSGAAPFIYTKF